MSGVTINGSDYEFASIEARADGEIYVGIQSIDYTQAMEPGDIYGTSRQKIGRTDGELKPEASMEMLKSDFQRMVKRFGNGYMLKIFGVVVSYRQAGQDLVTDELHACRIKKHQDSHKKGTEVLTVKVDLDIMGITYNGVKPTPDDLVSL